MRLSEIDRRAVDEDDVEVDMEYAEDYYYERDCGYTIVRMLRGRTTGRKLKRLVWKCGCYQVRAHITHSLNESLTHSLFHSCGH